ncbi:MAG TPA: MBL fold metallo-hydrolase [Tepidiformaceae bacterium]|nr:MBL fold metallo-hydrolase [Tepidiformaceae bacterium]
MTAFEVVSFRRGPFWNLAYLLIDSETREAAIIDPAWDIHAILAEAAARELHVSTAILTHGHFDHAHGLDTLITRTGARIILHEAEVAEVRQDYAGPLEALDGAATLTLGSATLEILPTPGHSPGSLAIRARDDLFTGDTLMSGAIGRPGYEPGALSAFWQTVSTTLRDLPAHLTIRPGHDSGPTPTSTLALERARLPALTATTYEGFALAVAAATGRRRG